MKKLRLITTLLLTVVMVSTCCLGANALSAKAVKGLHCREKSSNSIYVYWKNTSHTYYKVTAKCDGKLYKKGTYTTKNNYLTFNNLERGHKYRFNVVTVRGSAKSSTRTVCLRLNKQTNNQTNNQTSKKLNAPTISGKSTGRRCELYWSRVNDAQYYCLNETNCQTNNTKTYKFNNPDIISTIIDGKGIGEKYTYTIRACTSATSKESSDWSKSITLTTKKTTIGQAASNYDKKAGDSSGREVATGNWKYSSSSTSVRNWTYVFRFKDPSKAEMAATMCEKAIANNNIGYCSTGTKTYGTNALQKVAKPLNWDLSKVSVKTGCSCGDLIMLCTRYAGIDCKYIGDGVGCSKEFKRLSQYFECYTDKKYVADDALLHRGDILITAHSNGKNNHVCMVL